MSEPYAATLGDIRAAAARILGLAHRTPVLTCEALDRLAGRRLYLKAEHLQRVGAFKFRGAQSAVGRLDDATAARGVLTHSSGNHAQALALAARLRGVPAHIVMPTDAPAPKRAAVLGYGAIVHDCDPQPEARARVAAEVEAATGAVFIPSYDHPDVIAGQGTAGLELVEQAGPLDAVIVPVGGGGLLAGITLAVRALSPGTRIIAAEPAGADDAARSKAAGRLIPQTAPATVADGLRTSLGRHTWPVLRDLVDEVVTVDEGAIVEAMRLLWTRAKQVVEPSGAVPLAAALSPTLRARPGLARVGLLLSGGNVDLDALPW